MTTPTLFSVEGLDLNGLLSVISGTVNPSIGLGIDADIGSMYLRSNGETWKKVGVGTVDWALDAGSVDTSTHALILQSILVTDDYEVALDVGTVSFNHYYEDGVTCTLKPAIYYKQPITIKNLSGQTLEIIPQSGRIEGKQKYYLNNRYASITVMPLNNDWVITAVVLGVKYTLDTSCSCICKNEHP